MHLLRMIERRPGLIFCLALVLGIVAPLPWSIGSLLQWLMGFLLFLSFLGVNLVHVRSELKQPVRLAVQILLQFILLPLALFAVLRSAGLPTYATAAMLLAAMPAGLGSPVFTAIARGRMETSVVYSVITHLLVPVTVPLLFWIATNVAVQVDSIAIAKQLALLVGIPMVLAAVMRTYAAGAVECTRSLRKPASILALAAVAYIAITPHAGTIRSDVLSVIPLLVGLYVFYVVLCLAAFACTVGRMPEERAAIIVSRIYMNNALAIVLATKFFSKDVAFAMILAEIPWFTTFSAYLWFQKRFMKLSPSA